MMTLMDQPCPSFRSLKVPVKNDTKFEHGNTDKLTSSFALSPQGQIIITQVLNVRKFLLLSCARSGGDIGSFGRGASVGVGAIGVGMFMSIVRSLVV